MKKNILCFGDSNTYGYDPYTGGRYGEEIRWTRLLQKKLGDRANLVEEGMNGRTSVFDDPLRECVSGMDAIACCMYSHKPVDILLIMLGTNDAKERFGANAQCIGLGIKFLAEKALSLKDAWRAQKPTLVLIAPQAISRDYLKNEDMGLPMGPGCDKKTEMLPMEIKKWADFLGAYFVNADAEMKSPVDPVTYMHLTPEGHQEMAELLYQKLAEEWKLI